MSVKKLPENLPFFFDGSEVLFRMYYAFKGHQGLLEDHVLRWVARFLKKHKGRLAFFAFDTQYSKKRRTHLYASYKSHRPAMDEEFLEAWPRCVQAVKGHYAVWDHPSYEADDIIAHYACLKNAACEDVCVVASDKDFVQLAAYPHIYIYHPRKQCVIHDGYVQDRYGVSACLMRDFQALVGDKADGIPGVPGLGPKRVSHLINTYGDVDRMIVHPLLPQKMRDLLYRYQSDIKLWKTLVSFIPLDEEEKFL